MCRICGRVVKCIFDSMPSKLPSTIGTRSFATTTKARPSRSNHAHNTSRSLIRSSFHIDKQRAVVPPPTFLLPFRAKLHQATATQTPAPPASRAAAAADLPPSLLQSTQPKLVNEVQGHEISLKQPSQSSKPLVLSNSVQELLPQLTAQTPHYITVHVHRFPYLVTAGDTLRLPFYMHGVNSGDVIRLNRASILGSRDYTLKAGTSSTETYDKKRTGEPNYIDERMFEARARVMGVDTGPMMIKEKTKRRNRKVKTVRSKHRHTVLKIMEVRVKTLEELKMDKGILLLES